MADKPILRLAGVAASTLLLVCALAGPALAADKSMCKHGGWKTLETAGGDSFKSQGDCVSYVNAGGVPMPPAPTLVVAYADNGNHVYDADDVMIAKIVDTVEDGKVGAGDTIRMGRYPTNLTATAFGEWRIKSHPVTSADLDSNPDATQVQSGDDFRFGWFRLSGVGTPDAFVEIDNGASATSAIADYSFAGGNDRIDYDVGSPSKPTETLLLNLVSTSDDHFIDVEIVAP